MPDDNERFVWGTETTRRESGIPFLVYEPRRTDAAQLLDDVRHWGDRVHLVRGGQRMTYGELLDLVPRVGTVLRDHGVGPGGRVMLLAFNSAEWIVGFWATLAAGAVVVLANAWWSEAELRHALGVVDVDLVLADPRSATLVPAGVPVLELEEMVAQAAGRPALAGAASGRGGRAGARPVHVGHERTAEGSGAPPPVGHRPPAHAAPCDPPAAPHPWR